MNHPIVPLRHLLELHDAGVWGPEDRTNGIGVLRSVNFNCDGSIRFDNVSLRDIEHRKRVSKKLLPNDIILEKSGGGPKQPVGRVCLYRGHHAEHAFGNFTTRLRADRSTVDPEYLFWCLRHLHTSGGTKQYQEHTSGIRNLETKRYLEHPIPLPPLDEQRRIVDILNRAARIETLRRRAGERLREFVPALFVRTFGDPVQNPMGWRLSKLKNCCVKVQYGTSTKANDHGEGIPVLRMGNVTYNGDLDHTDLKHVVLSDAEMTKYRLQVGDILFNRTNSRKLVGKTGLWDGRFPAVAASYFIRVRLDQSRVDPTYVWAAMNSAAMKGRLFRMARGAIGQANINARELKSIPLPVPPTPLQNRFAKTVEAARAIARVRESSARSTGTLMAALMSELLLNDVSPLPPPFGCD